MHRILWPAVATIAFVVPTTAIADNPPPELIPQVGHAAALASVAFSPDGNWAVSADFSGTAILWDMSAGRQVRVVRHNTSRDSYGGLTCAAFSPTGRIFATGGERSTVILWHVATGTAAQVLRKPKQAPAASGPSEAAANPADADFDDLTSIAFSPDGKKLIAGSRHGSVWLWDVETAKVIQTFAGDNASVRNVAFSPDGSQVAAARRAGEPNVWNVSTGGRQDAVRTPESEDGGDRDDGDVCSVAFSHDGRSLACGDTEGSLMLREIASGKVIRKFAGHNDAIGSLAFDRDGARLVSASDDGTAAVWEVGSGRRLQRLKGDGHDLTCVAFSPDGASILTGSTDKAVILWDVRTGGQRKVFHGLSRRPIQIASSSDGLLLLVGSEQAAVLWDLRQGLPVREFRSKRHKEDGDAAQSVAISPDGRQALSGGRFGEARLWDVATGRELFTFHATHGDKYAYVTTVGFTADGKYLFTAGWGGNATLHDRMTGASLREFHGYSRAIRAAAVSPNRQLVLTSGIQWRDRPAILWDARTAEEICVFQELDSGVSAATFSPDGNNLLIGCDDGSVRFYETATRKQIATLAGHTDSVSGLAFSPDGRFFLVASLDQSASLWDASSRQRLCRLDGHIGPVESCVFAGTGNLVFTGSNDGTVGMWDPATGRLLARLLNLEPGVHWLIYTPEGLFDSSDGGTQFVAHRIPGANRLLSDEVVCRDFRRPGLLRELMQRGAPPVPETGK